jgi:hypothetical protein
VSGSVHLTEISALGARRISTDANAIDLSFGRAEIPNDDLESETDKFLLGAYAGDITVTGGTSEDFETSVDAYLKAGADVPLTRCLGAGGAVGTRAVMSMATISKVMITNERGQRRDFQVTAKIGGDYRPDIGGTVLYQSIGTAGLGATANGTGVELGALGAGQELLVFLHVVDPPGVTGTSPTLDALLQSDADDTWASAVSRVTFTQLTDTGWLVARIDGDTDPVTDTWWRMRFVVGGADPLFYPIAAAVLRSK